MVAFYILRLVIAIYSTQVFASTECVKLNLESGEIAHGKPITASSTCEAFETYCYLRGKIEVVFYSLYGFLKTTQNCTTPNCFDCDRSRIYYIIIFYIRIYFPSITPSIVEFKILLSINHFVCVLFVNRHCLSCTQTYASDI